MILERLKPVFKPHQLLIREPMSAHTSFKIGGPAKAIILPETIDELREALNLCKQENETYHVMGNGSNILVEDSGVDAVVVKISDNFSHISIEGEEIIAEAGVLLSKLARVAKKNALQGLEFASGIPGTLGGAIFMNAGAYGGEMKDLVQWVEVLTEDGLIKRLDNASMAFGYRKSIICEKKWIVLRCALKLTKGDVRVIEEITTELTKKRVEKQPLDIPSAGSTFKRPEGYFAGKLIEDAGLRGLRHGDAQVSDKHCGFIVNVGQATCGEVLDLIQVVQKVVKDTFDVNLEREIRIFGKE